MHGYAERDRSYYCQRQYGHYCVNQFGGFNPVAKAGWQISVLICLSLPMTVTTIQTLLILVMI